jgi:hypothetical protein
MRLTIIALIALLPLAASAEEPWGKVDLKSAKPLHDKACVSCHVRMYGGDGSKMYTRDGRLLSTKLDVLQRVARATQWSVQAGSPKRKPALRPG